MSTPDLDAAPGSPASLRTANQERVLTALRDHVLDDADTAPVFTQAELARTTGLAPATVSGIVRDLAGRGLVQAVPGSGRRGSTVRLSPGAGLVAGVDFGHSHVAVALGDLTGRVLDEVRHPLEEADSAAALALARRLLDDLLAGADGVPLRQVGLGLPAPVSDSVVQSAEIFPGWEGVDPQRAAAEAFGAPVHVENDANLGALAEHRHGAGRGHDSSVFVKISSGVGAGIIIGNQLFHGAAGTAGELGHLTLDDQGPLCRCGSRGCLEVYTALPFVREASAGQLSEAEVDDVVAAALHGNVAARRGLEEAGLHLGWGLAGLVNLLNPAVVVVGGDMARAGDLLLDAARLGLRRHALDAVADTPVIAGQLGERASLVGAVLLAAERIRLIELAAPLA